MDTPQELAERKNETLALQHLKGLRLEEVKGIEEEEVPSFLQNRAYVVGGDSVGLMEWVPDNPGEQFVGKLEGIVRMNMGGIAVRFTCGSQKIMLKKGGKIFEDRFMATDPKRGEWYYVKFKGELPAKQGQNPARDWLVIKFF